MLSARMTKYMERTVHVVSMRGSDWWISWGYVISILYTLQAGVTRVQTALWVFETCTESVYYPRMGFLSSFSVCPTQADHHRRVVCARTLYTHQTQDADRMLVYVLHHNLHKIQKIPKFHTNLCNIYIGPTTQALENYIVV